MRLRRGKFSAIGGVPSAYSLITVPIIKGAVVDGGIVCRMGLTDLLNRAVDPFVSRDYDLRLNDNIGVGYASAGAAKPWLLPPIISSLPACASI